MILGFVRRLVGLASLLVVAYAAVTVPIGRRTAYGHLLAIFTTAPAREAAEDIKSTGVQLGTRLAAHHGADFLRPAVSQPPTAAPSSARPTRAAHSLSTSSSGAPPPLPVRPSPW